MGSIVAGYRNDEGKGSWGFAASDQARLYVTEKLIGDASNSISNVASRLFAFSKSADIVIKNQHWQSSMYQKTVAKGEGARLNTYMGVQHSLQGYMFRDQIPLQRWPSGTEQIYPLYAENNSLAKKHNNIYCNEYDLGYAMGFEQIPKISRAHKKSLISI